MVDQVIPIQDIASLGVIKDIPNISLPPNAYSGVKNIRFHDGAAWKMEGEKNLNIASSDLTGNILYAAYWQAPQAEYYVVVTDASPSGNVLVFSTAATPVLLSTNTMPTGTSPAWQHTLFNGGFNFILNNGISAPYYFSDPITTDGTIAVLPNWDSYLSQENVTTVVWDTFNNEINLGLLVPATGSTILYSVTPRDTSIGVLNAEVTGQPDGNDPFSLKVEDGVSIITPMERTETTAGALPGDTISISIRDDTVIQVRAGVIRAYGNLLVAGDLTETDPGNSDAIIRRLPGTIRTSDVAAPGAIPLNWNPFRVGANTADEFILSSTGVVQDMAELQGVMYVYTDVSIHGIQQTGNPTIPFQISTVTDSYGCNSLGAVMEFDGRHLVVGSQDIYVFAGHPGSIASVGDGKVRHYAYEQPANGVDVDNVRMVRNQKYDEIWIFTPEVARTEMLVWNYRSQAWTLRNQSGVVSGTQGIRSPLFANATAVFEGDAINSYVKYNDDRNNANPEDDVDGTYESYVERMRLGLTPEFDTETVGATAMMYTSSTLSPPPPNLTLTMRGSSYPSDNKGIADATNPKEFTFIGENDYKVDTRIQGRFINYKISDDFQDKTWNITGYQLEIMKGGKR